MLKLSRRSFIVSTGAGIATVAAIDPFRYMPWLDDGAYTVIENQFLKIYRPLVLRDIRNLVIRNCHLIAMPGFEGDVMLKATGCDKADISRCVFDGEHAGILRHAIHVEGFSPLYPITPAPPPHGERGTISRPLPISRE